MRKLKLESLQVESFDTTPVAPQARGTVDGHAKPTRPGTLLTYSPADCGETNYMDCTYGCSINTACPTGCIEVRAEPSPFDVTV
jgi:hypothetical protein